MIAEKQNPNQGEWFDAVCVNWEVGMVPSWVEVNNGCNEHELYVTEEAIDWQVINPSVPDPLCQRAPFQWPLDSFASITYK